MDESKASRLKQGDCQQLQSLLTTLFEIDTSPVPQRNAGSSSLLKLDAIDRDSMLEAAAGSDQPSKSIKSKRSSDVASSRRHGSISQVILEPID